MSFQFFINPSNGIAVGLAWVLDINEDIISINNDKNIKLFSQDFINITLETGRCIAKLKSYYLILKVAVSSLEDHLLFIAYFYPYLIINNCEMDLNELFGLT